MGIVVFRATHHDMKLQGRDINQETPTLRGLNSWLSAWCVGVLNRAINLTGQYMLRDHAGTTAPPSALCGPPGQRPWGGGGRGVSGPPAAHQLQAPTIVCAATVQLPNIMSQLRNTFGGLQHGNVAQDLEGDAASSFCSSEGRAQFLPHFLFW